VEVTQQISLTGRVAVITGAGSGIGRASTLLLARHGARVHACDIDNDAAEAVAAQVRASGGQATAHELDVSAPELVEALAAALFAEHGHVDILHNNAGIGHGGDIAGTTVEDWQRIINVNLLGVAYGIQAFVPRMLGQGRGASVINTASMAGIVPAAKMAPYCASKYGVVGLSEALNAELSKRGIHVSAICPGVINTPIVARAIMRGEMAAIHDKAVGFYGKHGASPDEVAQAVLRTIESHKLIVPVPRRQVTAPYLLHRLSPRLTQPLARSLIRIVSR
jgi:NAD(P)-dependent dehydrogenase (short-subunit alcohol dehydrogenase family)